MIIVGRARELEEKRVNKELANIRSKFKDPSLSGRQKKKYVCKLLYMYILGWDVDFGHMEAVNLLSSSKYSEKQIGYLAVTLMLAENTDLLRLVVNSMRKDLDFSLHGNEVFQCLALHAIANIGAREMADALAGDVMRLLEEGRTFVAKKAALCLLRLFRRHPDLVPAKDWLSRIVKMMEGHDMGLMLAVVSLVLAMAQQFPDDACAICQPRAITVLHKIVLEKAYTSDYVYYKVPVPWLQVKLLRLLQYFPPPSDNSLRNRLMSVIQTIMTNAQDIPKNVQHNNAQNAVLFEAINLGIHMDPESDLVGQAASLLGRFISSKETNIRYLGLETMAHLAGFAESVDKVKSHQDTIIQSLKDKDISVRRRALDLLYSMCDSTNARTIVSELLQYLPISDFALREEMVLKIAIITEKFATDYSWYVDVILQLITIAGDNVNNEIWYRVVQIVTNNEDLQEYAVRTVLNTLKSPTCHETALKVGAYILGEFGHLIANSPGCSPMEQFMALHSKFGMCNEETRALMLTTYIKFVNVFPEIKDQIIRVFKQYRFVLDVELQQRACEYLAVASMPTDDLLQTICEEMPPWPERESALLAQLHKKIQDTEDKRTWQIGGKDANQEGLTVKKTDRRRSAFGSSENVAQGGGSARNELDDLLGLTAEPVPQADLDDRYHKLVLEANGVLYEDQYIQIGLQTEYHGHLGRMALFFGNKSTAAISDLTTDVKTGEGVKATLIQPIASSIPPATQYHQMYNVELLDVDCAVNMTVSYRIGSQPVHLAPRMPIVLSKFVSAVEMTSADFFQRWRQIGGAPREYQAISKLRSPPNVVELKDVVKRLGFEVLEGLEQNPNNIVGAGIFSAAVLGKIGCLIRVEINVDQQMFRITMRTTNDRVSEALGSHLRTVLENQ
ncbi:adaptin N terminal region-domain-containing protein [Gaertneriomyces semiglobifer]|nr:adaptin N terminal region-domain-containing protein [Gaertneriomyces semiglobifer]